MVWKKSGGKLHQRHPRKTKAGAILHAARAARNLGLREVEEATGISWSAIARAENGFSVPTVKHCYLLAKFYHIPLNKLVEAVMKDTQ